MKYKRSIFILLFTAIFIFSQAGLVEARIRGGSRGFGGSSRSWGRSWGSSWGSSSKSYSSSSSARKFGSSGWTRSSRSSNLRNSYMKDYYTKETSKRNYKKYTQNLNSDQQKAYNAASGRSYNFKNKMNFEDAMRTRTQRISDFGRRASRIGINNFYFGGPISYGSAFVGPWDLWFLMRASDLFWFHHWNDIYPHRDYFDAAEFAEMESRVKALEQQNIVRDESYLEPGADPDLQFSEDYQQKNMSNIYATNKNPVSAGGIIIILIVAAGVVVILVAAIRRNSRPRRFSSPGNRSNGSIY